MRELKTKKGTPLPLVNLKGKEYMQVATRLVWFREEHPDWSIETEFVSMDEQKAVAKATIKDEKGRVVSTSHKEESLKDFPAGYREKAETGAIGRALALCGYGTQFEPEFDEGERVVDSPIGRKPTVSPDQPEPGDGIQNLDRGYMIDFGKWNRKSLEQVYNNEGPKEIANYIAYLEKTATLSGKPLGPQVVKFISEAEQFLGAMENQTVA